MKEWNFGRLSGHHLCVRVFWPWRLSEFDGDRGEWRPSWLALVNPLNWWQTVRSRGSWELYWKYWPHGNHRCYCQTGAMFDGVIAVADFRLVWFWSRFGGVLPCPCDVTCAELFGEDE